MGESVSVTFSASIPTIKSAILLHGDDGATLKLELPAISEEQAVKLLGMKGKPLKVTIEAMGREPLGEMYG